MTPLKLNFIYAYPLDGRQRRSYEEPSLPYPSIGEVKEVIEHWNTVWNEVDETHRVLKYIGELTKRTPERNLECFVFGAGLGAMSTPFLLPTRNRLGDVWNDDKFVDLVIHELLHIFLITNNDDYWAMFREKYKDEEPSCVNHVLLYAMIYNIYKELFDREPMDFRRDNLPTGYARAIAIVNEVGYKELIEEYKDFA